MVWLKCDDSLLDHPKFLALQQHRECAPAMLLWLRGGLWASKHLTDGRLSTIAFKQIGHTPKLAALLVSVGFWEEADDGYQIHDFTFWNPSKEETLERRAKGAARNAKSRQRHSDSVEQCVTPPPCSSARQRSSDGVTNATPGPTQPAPEPPVAPEGAGSTSEHDSQSPLVTAEHVRHAVESEARSRGISPVPEISRSQLACAARRAGELARNGTCSTAESAAAVLVAAAFSHHLSQRRPLGFALAEVVIVGGATTACAQAAHVSPKDKNV